MSSRPAVLAVRGACEALPGFHWLEVPARDPVPDRPEGNAGNEVAAGTGLLEPLAAAQVVEAGDDRCDCCVELFSFRTRVVCRCDGAAVPAAAELDAAAAHPLLEVVAPCIPESAGNVG